LTCVIWAPVDAKHCYSLHGLFYYFADFFLSFLFIASELSFSPSGGGVFCRPRTRAMVGGYRPPLDMVCCLFLFFLVSVPLTRLLFFLEKFVWMSFFFWSDSIISPRLQPPLSTACFVFQHVPDATNDCRLFSMFFPRRFLFSKVLFSIRLNCVHILEIRSFFCCWM